MRETEIELLCVGNAMVDVFVPATAEQLDSLGVTDPVRHTDPQTVRDILRSFPDVFFSAGGGAGNVAKVAAGLGLAVTFLGAVGDDSLGRFYETELERTGARVRLFRGMNPTGICVIFQLPGGANRIVSAPAAALEFPGAFIEDELIQNARALALDGFMLRREDLTRHIFDRANRYGTVMVLDMGAPEIAGEQAANILRHSGEYPLILLMNEDETRAFYHGVLSSPQLRQKIREFPAVREQHEKDGDIHRIFRFLRDLTAEDVFLIVAVKQGKRGSTVFAGGTVYRKTTRAIIPRDSTGAGDSFCAAFLAAWLRGKSLADCADLGNRVARETLGINGTGVDPGKLAQIAKSRLA
ncbi:MAG: carbohydrate kinase family protein [Treponema sp.]|jgi:sugar/nucleoside kinase (ribokinase family)|nr:carbohydrate kinase family protein [Treponema sp.]